MGRESEEISCGRSDFRKLKSQDGGDFMSFRGRLALAVEYGVISNFDGVTEG
jgi:hypothetical protein